MVFNENWFKTKESPASEVGVVARDNLKSKVISTRPNALVHTGITLEPRIIALLGALLPGVSCYFCIAYTFIFQQSEVENYTTIDCPGIARATGTPPVSYSIETEPQKYVWLITMFIHLPFRLMIPVIYSRLYQSFKQKQSQTRWFQTVYFLYARFMFGEIIGLLLLSIFDMHTGFFFHAIGFVLWITSFNGNAIGGSILYAATGIQQINQKVN
uniref:G protein-coupled receptor n=1 Tax=Syphacia muris TaxID=451379 RepID=A0A0N5ALP7_9BILA